MISLLGFYLVYVICENVKILLTHTREQRLSSSDYSIHLFQFIMVWRIIYQNNFMTTSSRMLFKEHYGFSYVLDSTVASATVMWSPVSTLFYRILVFLILYSN